MKKFPLHILSRSQSGFTLIEILVSLFLFSIASLGLGKTFINTLAVNTRNERRTAGVQAVQQVLDNLRTKDPSTLPTGNTTQTSTITIGNRNFSVAVTYCPAGTIYCTANIRDLDVIASLNGGVVYETRTVYAKLH
jgi:prepilin-type N-terminal cleavage/methylation domain-containing protein